MMQIIYLTPIIPVLHFATAYYFAKKDRVLQKLKKTYSVMYLDWLFVLVNISLALNQSYTLASLGLFFVLCLVPIIHLKSKWRKHRYKHKTLFFRYNGSLNNVGIVHTLFMLFQGTLSLQFFFSPANNIAYFLGLLGLLSYLGAYCIIIKYVRKLRFTQKAEMPYVVFGLVLVIVRIVFAMYELSIL